MSDRFEEAVEIISRMRDELEDAMWNHFSFLEHYVNERNSIFICSKCLTKFSRADNRKRHCLNFNIHNSFICDISNCTEEFRRRCDLDAHRRNDSHYCVACIDYHKGRQKCPLRTFTPNAGPDVSAITDAGSLHSFQTPEQ